MSQQNFPANRKDIGVTIFPHVKGIRNSDPNYYHYQPSAPLYGDKHTKVDDKNQSPRVEVKQNFSLSNVSSNSPRSTHETSYKASSGNASFNDSYDDDLRRQTFETVVRYEDRSDQRNGHTEAENRRAINEYLEHHGKLEKLDDFTQAVTPSPTVETAPFHPAHHVTDMVHEVESHVQEQESQIHTDESHVHHHTDESHVHHHSEASHEHKIESHEHMTESHSHESEIHTYNENEEETEIGRAYGERFNSEPQYDNELKDLINVLHHEHGEEFVPVSHVEEVKEEISVQHEVEEIEKHLHETSNVEHVPIHHEEQHVTGHHEQQQHVTTYHEEQQHVTGHHVEEQVNKYEDASHAHLYGSFRSDQLTPQKESHVHQDGHSMEHHVEHHAEKYGNAEVQHVHHDGHSMEHHVQPHAEKYGSVEVPHLHHDGHTTEHHVQHHQEKTIAEETVIPRQHETETTSANVRELIMQVERLSYEEPTGRSKQPPKQINVLEEKPSAVHTEIHSVHPEAHKVHNELETISHSLDVGVTEVKHGQESLKPITPTSPTQQFPELDELTKVKTDAIIAQLKRVGVDGGMKTLKDFKEENKLEQTRKEEELNAHLAKLKHEYTAERFLHTIPAQGGKNNIELPEWKRKQLAQKKADEAMKIEEQRLMREFEEWKMAQSPGWLKEIKQRKSQS